MNAHQTWRKSSRSGNANDCVELAVGVTQTKIRDTKSREAGALTLTDGAYRAFLAAVKGGHTES